LLYHLLKPIVRLAMLLFCRKVIVNKPKLLKSKGPLLLACNHPNSFLDAVILDVLFEQPVWSLARGDVFKKKWAARMLYRLKILPVYRTSEGVENLSENYKTFDDCIRLFKEGELVQIFSEGKCINEWHLRPLKKGTARLAIKAWEEGIPLKVLPVGINYSSYYRFGKNMFIQIGEPLDASAIDMNESEGQRHQSFNKQLKEQLEQLVFEIPKTDKEAQRQRLVIRPALIKRILLFIPSITGWALHAPLYLPVKKFTWKRTWNNDHYDSVMTGVLLALYPVYLLLVTIVLLLLTGSWWMLSAFLVFPFTAWAHVQLKAQPDK
jgi:1-acyl-sn-glycerol-3-phosphate acyltransferase